MARKCKIGIQYFSHDVDMAQDKKIKLIKAKHGLIGYAVFLRLLEEVYKENGYYLKIDEDFNILFSDDNNINYNDYILILNDCINKELFDEELYKKHNILTSRRIQENYASATERRKEVEFIQEYLLVDIEKFYVEKVNVIINVLNADNNDLNDNIGTQSKIKGKVKENDKKSELINIVVEFHNSLENLPKYRKLTDSRKSSISARITEYGIDEVKNALLKANNSKFLNEHEKWYDFDWIYNPSNFVKIIEGKYDNKQPTLLKELKDDNPFAFRGGQ